MFPDHRAVYHACCGIPFDRFSQGFKHRIEYARRHPASVASEYAVPLPIVIRQVTPLRSDSGNPNNTFEIQTIVLRRTAPTTRLTRKERPDDGSFFVRKPNMLAQRCLQKAALNQSGMVLSIFVHET